ncbi:hypothetical protein XMM379_000072 [Aliiroseovarius sp. xm-m-379]|uniref:sulfotransferase n=2 Tax=unclassified Aliiroseovarius TaxID=2623558 RepID=UPI00156A5128|nr:MULTISPECIES: sulfotransferase [unclassified Aliiroseovarius]NRP23401.1 hypothetical protein [Aliiroseovarius sp. xm-m-379]NRP32200.1 hypothetical protein [Aliiroseovarius sp. xm-a-104]NRP48621.1 hypothetical protein [Aliiroseovarius sp. xm-m-354]NRP64948.1 hypothetical protein [Aliiroseovarius sp. xm-v-225]NRP91887.1 hypothetical protein [Aliiroseovarius sp. xm-a-134]NRQ03374.1 hypothetical protein [Aliiroseovarius sp. xm-m-309]NRQ19320.1 hypothetical protein [Aliiroseovarius sp. xm-v-20
MGPMNLQPHLPRTRNDGIALLHGLPRSGTSLLGMLLAGHPDISYRYQPLVSYEYRDRLEEYLGHEGLETLAKELRTTQDPFIRQWRREDLDTHIQSVSRRPAPVMLIKQVRFHNHLNDWMRSPLAQLILLNRKPEDLIASQLTAFAELGQYELTEDTWRHAEQKNGNDENSFYGYEKIAEFREISSLLKARYPSRVLSLDYEDLVADPKAVLAQIFDFLQLEPAGQVTRLVDYLMESTETAPAGAYQKRRRIASRSKPYAPEIEEIRQIIRDEEGHQS